MRRKDRTKGIQMRANAKYVATAISVVLVLGFFSYLRADGGIDKEPKSHFSSINTILEVGGRASGGPEWVFLKINSRVPSFGGMYLDGQTLVVHLGDQADETAFRNELRALRESDLGASYSFLDYVTEVKFLPGNFTFRELADWKDAISTQFGRIDYFTASDADEQRNRLTLAVTDESAIPLLLHAARNLGIPEGGINFRMESAVAKREQVVLSDDWPNPAGGVQVALTGDPTACSLGFGGSLPLAFDLEIYVTASHCINDVQLVDGVTGDSFFQASPFRYYGTVYQNEPWSNADPACATTTYCTAADAMFLSGHSPNVPRKVKTPASASTVVTGEDSVTSVLSPFVGVTNVRRIGRTSGTSIGNILAVCENRITTGPIGNLMNLCVDRHSGFSSGGDSGGPYTWLYSGRVNFVGIHLGNQPDGIISTNWWQISAALQLFNVL